MSEIVRDILAGAKAHLISELSAAAGIREKDFFISPHEDFVPAGAQFSCIGIKDGAVEYGDQASGGIEAEIGLDVVVHTQILSWPEAGLMGTPTGEGLFQVCERVRKVMHWASLPVKDRCDIRVVGESPSVLLDAGHLNIQSKTIRCRATVWRR